jgi:hypothetical protein
MFVDLPPLPARCTPDAGTLGLPFTVTAASAAAAASAALNATLSAAALARGCGPLAAWLRGGSAAVGRGLAPSAVQPFGWAEVLQLLQVRVMGCVAAL